MPMTDMLMDPEAALPDPDSDEPTLVFGVDFEVITDAGTVRLQLQTPAVRHAVDAALALQRCDELLESLQRWTGFGLDWHWCPRAAARLPATTHAGVRWALQPDSDATLPPCGVAPPLQGRLDIPWQLLRELPAPDEDLAPCLEWTHVPVVLAVSEFSLSGEELSQLEPGGAVVLAESLSPVWQGRLRAAEESSCAGAGVPVSLSLPSACRLAGRASHDIGGRLDERIPCEVRLAMPSTLPGDRLAGWSEGDLLPEPSSRASMWCLPPGTSDAMCIAVGRLMPWADGWALAVESVRDVAMSAAMTH
ncbi:MAG TPA: hypothetical protein VFP68_21615 [Burkholderiaceae bacterium]|nr:hypothetical protein [Burkholderiaceae bacterium]